MGGNLHSLELVLMLLLAFVASIAGVARRWQKPYPIVLVIGGLLLSFVPHLPAIPLNPDIVFLVFLPPLLYSAAWQTSWRDFRFNFTSIAMLAVGLVGFTVIGVAWVANRWLLKEFDWRAGVLLGAVVSPTDAIAASAIAKRLGLPRRIVDVLEGESLLNDATGLLALEFGLDLMLHGTTPTITGGLLRLLWLVVGGVGVGLLLGVVFTRLEHWIDDGPVEIALGLVVPYGAYLAAEEVKASGVLAVVACGLYLGQQAARIFSPQVRMQAYAVWETLEFTLNGLVFVLIGLQLPTVLAGIKGYSHMEMIRNGIILSVALIVLRLVWVAPGSRVAYFIRRRLLRQHVPYPAMKASFVVGWTGMRGVVALAAALSLPEQIQQKNLIVFLTFCVIFVTVVLQGLTLPKVIRALGLDNQSGPDCEENEARKLVLEEALAYLQESRDRAGDHAGHAYEDLIHQYEHRLEAVTDCGDPDTTEGHSHRYREVALAAIHTERNALLRLRDEGRISDEVQRKIERELDLSEARREAPL
ncbi:MAG: Na+/H+ antiporter [Acidobacteria bacterium]|nr:Na+/H+ antiporter [Acidobacteriota bacterium]